MTNKNLPVAHPAEILQISPEALEVANCYLQHQDIGKVSDELGVSRDVVSQYLDKREVRAYVDSVFKDLGFNNKFKVRELLDAIIKKKLEDMDEAGTGSSKDIIEIMTLSHKFALDMLNAEIALEKARGHSGPRSQVNVQINEGAGGSNYANLLDKIINNNV